MGAFEEAKRLKALLNEVQAEIPTIEEVILKLSKEQPVLEKEVVKAEALKSGDAQEARKRAEENRERINQLKEKLKTTEEKVEIIKQELRQLEMPALQDIRKQYLPRYQSALKKLIPKLIEAKEAEAEVIKIVEEARELMREISFIPYAVLPPVRRLLIQQDGDRPEYAPINLFLKDCKDAGIEIER